MINKQLDFFMKEGSIKSSLVRSGTQQALLKCKNNHSSSSCQDKTSDNNPYLHTHFQIKVYNQLIEIKKPSSLVKIKLKHYRKRGNVHVFSHSSRFRLFVLLSKVDNRNFRYPKFLSLTWHYGFTKKGFNAQCTIHAFFSQLNRHFPGCNYIWRLEMQKRGAPHFHLILFPPIDFEEKQNISLIQFINDTWHRLADPFSKAHEKFGAKVTEIKNYRHACSYLSKYIAKEDETIDCKYRGRRWGNSKNITPQPIIETIMNHKQISILTRIIRKWLSIQPKQKTKWYENLNSSQSYSVFLPSDFSEKLLNFVFEKVPLVYG